MNTRPPAEFAALIDNLRDFIDTEVMPREDLRHAHDSDLRAGDNSHVQQAFAQRAVTTHLLDDGVVAG